VGSGVELLMLQDPSTAAWIAAFLADLTVHTVRSALGMILSSVCLSVTLSIVALWVSVGG